MDSLICELLETRGLLEWSSSHMTVLSSAYSRWWRRRGCRGGGGGGDGDGGACDGGGGAAAGAGGVGVRVWVGVEGWRRG